MVFLLAAAIVAAAPASHAASADGSHVYPPEVRGIIDVTKAPYFADNTGKKDCTAALIRAVDDAMREDHDAMAKTAEILRAGKKDVIEADKLSFAERQKVLAANPQAVIGFERCRGNFPYKNPAARILYFPNGTYLVSDTVVYTFRDLRNLRGTELNRCLHFQGESRQGTIIRLKDQSPGFGEGTPKAVVCFARRSGSNVAMQNSFENFTIEVGAGNPGAVGLEFFSNNTGAVRDVTIRSLDPGGAGHAGLGLRASNFSGVLIKNLTVEGFDDGVEVLKSRIYSVFENIRVSHQRAAGFYLEDNNVSLRGLVSDNKVPAVKIKGRSATMALVDGDFSGGGADAAAVECENGFLFARDLKSSGYGEAIRYDGKTAVRGPDVGDYVSSPVFTLFPAAPKQSLRLPVEETPEVPWDSDPKQWALVDRFGAKGDGFTDDTAAIRRAMNSGRSTVCFQPGTYLVNGPIDVPATVRRINLMYCDLVAGGDLQKMESTGLLRILDGREPLVIEKVYGFELFFGAMSFINHASTRTLVLKDLHTQLAAMYRNSVSGGKVFIENVACTNPVGGERNCFTFTGQKVWARQLNPERADPEVLNDGSSLWVLGFKTERAGCAFKTIHGGSTEVLNGSFNLWRHREETRPAIINDNSKVSVVASTTGGETGKKNPPYPYVLVEETRGDQTRQLLWDQLPHRDDDLVALPLYSGQ